jgi:hypothetical protein
MTHRCLPDGMLAEIDALSPGDPRRAEAEACPRCGAQLAALRAFLAGDPEIPAAESAAADRALAAFVATRLGSRRPSAAPARPSGRRPRPFAPRRLAAMASACAIVALALLLVRDAGDPAPIGARLRGEAPAAGTAAIVFQQAGPTADGGHELNWRPIAGADHYVVEVFSGDLDTLAVLAPLFRPTVRLAPGLLRSPAATGGVLVRVMALAGDRRLAVSPLQALTGR